MFIFEVGVIRFLGVQVDLRLGVYSLMDLTWALGKSLGALIGEVASRFGVSGSFSPCL